MNDPVAEMKKAIRAMLVERESPDSDIKYDWPIDPTVRWRPHVWDAADQRAWHCAPDDADGESWLSRLTRARSVLPQLRLGVCASAAVVSSVLDELDDLEASVIVVPDPDDDPTTSRVTYSATVCDFIYEQRIALEPALARLILDRNYQRALAATTNHEKGVRLEVVAAVVMSQVTGYHVAQRGISNRSQQMDVIVVNRNASGTLAGGGLVIVEAKNWKDPVTPNEYYSLMRKVENRNGRCKLGVLVTSGRFTRGVEDEVKVDSAKDVMILRLDGKSFPALWRDGAITEGYEQRMIEAISGVPAS